MAGLDMYRSSKQQRAYRKRVRSGEDGHCAFCNVTPQSPQFVKETESFKIIKNIFPYTVWDACTVTDHLMIVPKAHAETLAALTPFEAQEFIQLISSYEQEGYNVYARATQSVAKSVVHQHTHLIKTDNKTKRVWVGVHKPTIQFSL